MVRSELPQPPPTPPPKYSVYVLGAGFSVAAGLPVASQLWHEILRRALHMKGRAEKFREDLDEYIRYRSVCDGVNLTYEEVDLEEFIGFLDVEHYLGLRGSDTWSSHGNEGQIIVKTLIGQIITERTPPIDHIPDLYVYFARKLRPNDIVITFNYDILLERALERAEVPYRLFPSRFTEVSRLSATVATDDAEVTILKVHGSVDWFDKRGYFESLKNALATGGKPEHVHDPIFGHSAMWTLTRLVDGPRMEDDPLQELFRIREVEAFYDRPPWFLSVPSLISPSTQKLVYTGLVNDFWNGFGRAGATNFRLVIVGYSLPEHDDYARQVLFRLVDNYQRASPEWADFLKIERDPILVVDRRTDEAGVTELKTRYRVIDWSKASLQAGGFDEEVVTRL